MQKRAVYADVVQEVHDELSQRMAVMFDEGVDPEQIVLDPGLGFAKTAEQGHNWELLAHLDRFTALGRPLLVAGSRKRFLGRLLSDAQGRPRDFAGSDHATVALSALAAANGAWCVRVHDVGPTADAVRVAQAWRSGGESLTEGRADAPAPRGSR